MGGGTRGGTVANRRAALGATGLAGSPVETRRTEFVIGRLTKEITRSPRGLASVNASVVIFDRVRQAEDGSWEYDRSVKDDLEKYRRLVANALGSGQVEVEYMPSPWRTPPAALAGRDLGAAGWLARSAPVVMALVLAGAVVAFAARRSVERRAARTAAEAERAPPRPPLHPAEQLRREATRTAGEDTDRAAAILHRWIAREGVS